MIEEREETELVDEMNVPLYTRLGLGERGE